jgi:Svf1-like N-terminal lipocalin domain
VLIRHRGIRTTCQFNLKIFSHGGPFKHLWCSDPLSNYGFDEEQYCFYADNLAVELNGSGTSLTIKSAVNEDSIVNITVTQAAPGFQVGKDGTSYFGTDPSHPWGSMRHAFWPRCDVEGTIITKEKKYDMRGRALFIHALQGMKPHHAGMLAFLLTQNPHQ